MDKKLIFRLFIISFLIYSLYLTGVAFEALIILGILFLVLILVRGKLWNLTELAIKTHFPFTEKWSDKKQKIVVVIVFIIFYLILKQVIYFFLGIVGIDLQEMLSININ